MGSVGYEASGLEESKYVLLLESVAKVVLVVVEGWRHGMGRSCVSLAAEGLEFYISGKVKSVFSHSMNG